jgi:uncharacterized membrane protein
MVAFSSVDHSLRFIPLLPFLWPDYSLYPSPVLTGCIPGAYTVIAIILGFIPVIGWILSYVIGALAFILWIVLMVKAYQGQMYKLPIAGDIAEKNSKPQTANKPPETDNKPEASNKPSL